MSRIKNFERFIRSGDYVRGSKRTFECVAAPDGTLCIRGDIGTVGIGRTVVAFADNKGRAPYYECDSSKNGKVLFAVSVGDWIAVYDRTESQFILRPYHIQAVHKDKGVVAVLTDCVMMAGK